MGQSALPHVGRCAFLNRAAEEAARTESGKWCLAFLSVSFPTEQGMKRKALLRHEETGNYGSPPEKELEGIHLVCGVECFLWTKY